MSRRGRAAFGAGVPVLTAAGRVRLPSYDIATRATAPGDTLITALEIAHPDAAAPLRVVDAGGDRVIEGHTYTALRFEARLADDTDSRMPQAEIAMDNVGREATRWIDGAGGGHGASVRIMQLLDGASDPEWEMTLDVTRLQVGSERITVRLGFDPLLGRSAVSVRHDPATTPGIF